MNSTLLIIDDDKDFRSDLVLLLENEFECLEAKDSKEGIKLMNDKSPDIVLLDLMLNDGTNGLELLGKFKATNPDIPIIMITDYASVETAVEALKLGATDYISKTPNLDELRFIIDKSIEEKFIKLRTKSIEKEIEKDFANIIGDSPAVTKLREQIKLYSNNNNTVIITGESGVGKELVARQLHTQSEIKNNAFVSINCAAIPKNLIESELFGHEKGAFTGAVKTSHGKFELASEGTLFLDEISELDLDAQVKLLRVIQFKEFQRVGGNKTIKTNTRIVAATNKNLLNLVKKGYFREDLYYRLNVLPIEVPPLRERIQDIPLLCDHFLKKASIEMKVDRKIISQELLDQFSQYSWPGNIRELQNLITRACLISKESLISSNAINLEPGKDKNNFDSNLNVVPETWGEMDQLRKEAAAEASRNIERRYLENLLNKFDGNISKAAEHAGINRSNLHKMISKCGL